MSDDMQRLAVTIGVADDQAAHHVATVLEDLGYQVIRDIGGGEVSLAGTADKIAAQYEFTEQERDVLRHVIEGRSGDEITCACGFLSRATVKWVLHNIYEKTGTSSREALLRLALRYGQVAAED